MQNFFQAVATSILLYKCTTWMLTKHIEKRLDGDYTRMLHAILNKSWKQRNTKPKPITYHFTNHTRHAGNCWRSNDEHISGVIPWTHTQGLYWVGRLAKTYISSMWALDIAWRTFQERLMIGTDSKKVREHWCQCDLMMVGVLSSL